MKTITPFPTLLPPKWPHQLQTPSCGPAACLLHYFHSMATGSLVFSVKKSLNCFQIINCLLRLRFTCSYRIIGRREASIMVTGVPAGSMPADTHLFQVFLEGVSPYMSSSTSPSFFCRLLALSIAVCAGLFLCSLRTWPAIFLLHNCCNNVLESLHACSLHHFLICDIVAP